MTRAEGSPGPTAYLAAHLITGLGGVVHDAAVVVNGEALEYAGPRIEGYDGAFVTSVDLGDATILPGLINSHVHLTVSHLDVERPKRVNDGSEADRILAAAGRAQTCLLAGVTAVRDVGAADPGIFALRRAIADGVLPGARVFAAGALICATGGHAYSIGIEANGADGFRHATRLQLKAGADFVKVMADGGTSDGALDVARPALSQSELRAVIDAAHQLGRRVTAHAIAPATIRAVIEAGVDVIEHGYALDQPLAAMAAERDVAIVPTLSVHEAVLREEERTKTSVGWMEYVRRSQELSQQAVRFALSEGVRLAAGTDGGSPFNPHENLAGEIKLLAALGLGNVAAIEAASRVGAEILGAESAIGSLAAGREADVIAVRGDASVNLDGLDAPILIVQKGRVVRGPAGDVNAAAA